MCVKIWRGERSRREEKLEEEVRELTLRLNELAEQRRIANEEEDARRKVNLLCLRRRGDSSETPRVCCATPYAGELQWQGESFVSIASH